MSSSRPNSSSTLNRQVQAAIVIQRFWRRYIDIQVFKYYRDLVAFHNEGDPALIMKYINPIEAKFIDDASGIHIKFRLAGNQFPPTIYYKIFTHRPIQDICANAPRDYTKPYLKLKTAEQKNNRVKEFPKQTFDGWYQRVENNGWRPVSNKHLIQMNLDYYFGVQPKSAEKYEPFHHNRIARRQDIELKKKQKKIEWMKKMYQNGLLRAKDDDESVLVDKTAQKIIETFDQNGAENVDDWEVDELISWTNGLNYEEYVDDWKLIGTTSESDKISKRKQLRNGLSFERGESFLNTELQSRNSTSMKNKFESA